MRIQRPSNRVYSGHHKQPYRSAGRPSQNGHIKLQSVVEPLKTTPKSDGVKKVALLPSHWISSESLNNSRQVIPLIALPELNGKEQLLKFFDTQVWQSGVLFSNNKFSTPEEAELFYDEYLNHLSSIVEGNKNYFNFFKARDKGSTILNFDTVFNAIKSQDKLTKQERAIYLTWATELILMGINITPVLSIINKEYKSRDNHSPNGFRQELLANWFLAKFLLKGKFDYSQTNNIIPSVMVETKNKNKEIKEMEVDSLIQIHPYSLVSIRHNCIDSFPSKIKELGSKIACNDKLRDKIKKMIIISGSDDENKWHRDYKLSAECSSKKYASIVTAENLFNFRQYTDEQERCIKTFLQDDRIDFYHIPFVEDVEDLEKWTSLMYKEYDNALLLYQLKQAAS